MIDDGTGWFKLSDGERVDLNSLSEIEREALKHYEKEAISEIDISNSVVIKNLLQKHLTELKEAKEQVTSEQGDAEMIKE